MRALNVTLILVLLLGCASSGRVGPSQYFEADEGIIWSAALEAVQAMGAKVVVSNRTSGIIAATMNVVEIGGGVRLDISVDDQLRGSEVQVRASLKSSAEAGDAYREELQYLEKQYLDLVDQGISKLMSRRRGFTDQRWP